MVEKPGGESSPSSKEANASALENGDGCPAIADGLPDIDQDVSMEASSSHAPARGKRTEASAFNAPPIENTGSDDALLEEGHGGVQVQHLQHTRRPALSSSIVADPVGKLPVRRRWSVDLYNLSRSLAAVAMLAHGA